MTTPSPMEACTVGSLVALPSVPAMSRPPPEPTTTVDDALEFLIAGATTIGIGTALFYDPLICQKINEGITRYLAANGMRHVTELVGSLVLPGDEQSRSRAG